MCNILQVSTSGYYKWLKHTPSEWEQRRKLIQQRIEYYFAHFEQRAGSRPITNALHAEGIEVSAKTVARYMKDMGLQSITTKKR